LLFFTWKQYNKFGTFANGKVWCKQSIKTLAALNALDAVADLNERLFRDKGFSKLSNEQLELFRWLNND